MHMQNIRIEYTDCVLCWPTVQQPGNYQASTDIQMVRVRALLVRSANMPQSLGQRVVRHRGKFVYSSHSETSANAICAAVAAQLAEQIILGCLVCVCVCVCVPAYTRAYPSQHRSIICLAEQQAPAAAQRRGPACHLRERFAGGFICLQ